MPATLKMRHRASYTRVMARFLRWDSPLTFAAFVWISEEVILRLPRPRLEWDCQGTSEQGADAISSIGGGETGGPSIRS